MLLSTKKLTQNQTKLHNRRLVLRVIYEAGTISRADIARATGLTRTTSSSAVAELMGEGLVAEVGQGPSAGGKPPTLLGVVDDARCVIGVDLAGSEMQGCIYDLRGRSLHHARMPLPAGGGEKALDLVLKLIDELVSAAERPLLGIGVGAPGLIDAQRGIIQYAVNLGWRDLPLGTLLSERYGLAVYLVNDSQAAALAEYTFANPEKVSDLAVILVGRGISAGLVINDKLYRGSSHSGASEIGHLRVVEGGELCACGHIGCLETVASERAVLRWARANGGSDPNSRLHQSAQDADTLDMDDVLRAHQAGDEALDQMVAQVASYLSIAIGNLVGVLNIPLVVLTGTVARFGDSLAQPIRSEIRQRSLATLAVRTTVRVSELGQEIIMRGAAALLLTNELGVV
jgi:predicted NBD/HSP70 family sugar kinase